MGDINKRFVGFNPEESFTREELENGMPFLKEEQKKLESEKHQLFIEKLSELVNVYKVPNIEAINMANTMIDSQMKPKEVALKDKIKRFSTSDGSHTSLNVSDREEEVEELEGEIHKLIDANNEDISFADKIKNNDLIKEKYLKLESNKKYFDKKDAMLEKKVEKAEVYEEKLESINDLTDELSKAPLSEVIGIKNQMKAILINKDCNEKQAERICDNIIKNIMIKKAPVINNNIKEKDSVDDIKDSNLVKAPTIDDDIKEIDNIADLKDDILDKAPIIDNDIKEIDDIADLEVTLDGEEKKDPENIKEANQELKNKINKAKKITEIVAAVVAAIVVVSCILPIAIPLVVPSTAAIAAAGGMEIGKKFSGK
jgi:hypothetical protein